MEDRDRRTFLKELGAATTLTAAAGCLGGGEEEESTPNDTSSPTDTPEDTPTEEPTTNETEESGEETTEDDSPVNTYEDSVIRYAPTEIAGNKMGRFGHALPAEIADAIGEEMASEYEENAWYAPEWADVKLDQIEEKSVSGAVISGAPRNTVVYSFSEDISGRFSDYMEQTGEIEGYRLLEGENEEGDAVVVAYNDGVAFEVHPRDPERKPEELITAGIEASNGERERLIDQRDSAGFALKQVPYEHSIDISGAGFPWEASRIEYEEDKILTELIEVMEDGQLEVRDSNEYDVSESYEPF